jgi:hypothetical protein
MQCQIQRIVITARFSGCGNRFSENDRKADSSRPKGGRALVMIIRSRHQRELPFRVTMICTGWSCNNADRRGDSLLPARRLDHGR